MKNFATALWLTGLSAAADQLTVGEYAEKTKNVEAQGYQWLIEGKKVDDDNTRLMFITDRIDNPDNAKDTKDSTHLKQGEKIIERIYNQ